jgi:amino-acid N-acetyltransferase
LTVAPEYTRTGLGKIIVNKLLEEAKDLGVPQVFALTYQPDFFSKCGFSLVDKNQLPQKVWTECINCPKFPNCEENAMIINLEALQ